MADPVLPALAFWFLLVLPPEGERGAVVRFPTEAACEETRDKILMATPTALLTRCSPHPAR